MTKFKVAEGRYNCRKRLEHLYYMYPDDPSEVEKDKFTAEVFETAIEAKEEGFIDNVNIEMICAQLAAEDRRDREG